jgi:hypothetical protein
VAARQDNRNCESAKSKPKLCDAGLRLAMSILSGFPPEVRFLRTRPNVKIDRVGLHTRVRPSVRASRSARDGGWDGRRGKLGPLQLNNPFPGTNVANAQTIALGKREE